jgi:hypothetical protein
MTDIDTSPPTKDAEVREVESTTETDPQVSTATPSPNDPASEVTDAPAVPPAAESLPPPSPVLPVSPVPPTSSEVTAPSTPAFPTNEPQVPPEVKTLQGMFPDFDAIILYGAFTSNEYYLI